MLSMVTSIMLNSNMITLLILETNNNSEPMLKISQFQICIIIPANHNMFKLNLIPILDGDQFKNMNGSMNMMVSLNGLLMVGLELKVP